MRKIWSALCVTVLLIAVASPTSALDCATWNRLNYPDDRRAVIENEVWAVLDSGAASSWNVNHNAIGRCVMRRMRQLEVDIDDTCDQGMRASLQAVDELIMNYIRSCVY